MGLRDVVKRHQIRFKKSLGQNLLLDDNINRIMVDAAAISPADDVVEVGAGLGALTRHLAPVAGRVLAIEIDRSFIPVLEEQLGGAENVRVFRGDVLNHAVDELIDAHLSGGDTLKMVSNLPYYVTTPLLFHFWSASHEFERFVVMVQEEVAARLTAPPKSSQFGRLSIAAQLYAEVDIVHRVSRTCFTPRPKVDSCIVRLRNRPEPLFPGVDEPLLLNIAGAAFRHRRKTLRNSLIKPGLAGLLPDQVAAALDESGISPQARPQDLSLADFATLARCCAAMKPNDSGSMG